MGFFSNGDEGRIYQEIYCSKCINWKEDEFGHGCPIWDLHLNHSYELCNSRSLAKRMLDYLIPKGTCFNGQCRMFQVSKEK